MFYGNHGNEACSHWIMMQCNLIFMYFNMNILCGVFQFLEVYCNFTYMKFQKQFNVRLWFFLFMQHDPHELCSEGHESDACVSPRIFIDIKYR